MKKIITLIIIFASTGFIYAQSPTIGETTKIKRPRSFLYTKYETPVNTILEVTTQKKLYVVNGAGHIKVNSGEIDKIQIEGKVRTRSLRKKATEKFIDNYLVFEVEEEDETQLVLKSYFEGHPTPKKGTLYKLGHMLGTPISKVELTLTLPKGMDIEIRDNSGPISVKDFEGNVAIRDDSGGIEIHRVQGNVDIRDRSGGIEVSHVTGGLTIRDNSGRINAKDIGGSSEIRDASGRIALSKIGQSLKITDNSGGIDLQNISTDTQKPHNIYIKDKSGRITAEKLGAASTIIDRSGRIYFRDVTGDVRINDKSGGISAKQINGRLLVKDRSGKIHTDEYIIANGTTKQ